MISWPLTRGSLAGFASGVLLLFALMFAASPAFAQSVDTLLVFGPTQYVRLSGGTNTAYTESFGATPTPGRRFILQLVNATQNTGLHLHSFTVRLNGLEVVGSAEFVDGTALSKQVELAASNSAVFTLTADQGVRVTVRIVSVPDPTFGVFGPERFTRAKVNPTRSFALPAGAGGPFWLVLVNGAGVPAQRADDVYIWLNGVQVVGKPDVSLGVASLTRQVTLLSQNNLEVRVICKSTDDFITLKFTATDVARPLLTITSPTERLLTALTSVTAAGAVQDATTVHVTVNGTPLAVGTGGSFSGDIALPAEGTNLLQFTATDAAGNHTDSTRTVIRDTRAPVLVVNQPADGAVTTSASIAASGTASDSSAFVVTLNGDTLAVGAGGAFSTTRALALGSNTLTFVATDVLGHATTVTRSVTRNSAGPTLPPDPSTVAPALDPTGVTTFVDATAFLYSGTSPIQTGVAPGTIAAQRVAVLRGKVLMRDGSVLPGATVRILNHPEFGQTLSRADGMYDLAVNGGGSLILVYEKSGFLAAQRRVEVPWRDFLAVEDVALVGLDPEVTAIDFGEPVEVARGSSVTD